MRWLRPSSVTGNPSGELVSVPVVTIVDDGDGADGAGDGSGTVKQSPGRASMACVGMVKRMCDFGEDTGVVMFLVHRSRKKWISRCSRWQMNRDWTFASVLA